LVAICFLFSGLYRSAAEWPAYVKSDWGAG
jgi:hypothetical protein